MNFKNNVNEFIGNFRSCANCGSGLRQKHFLCRTCDEILLQSKLESYLAEFVFPVYALCSWQDWNHRFCQRIIYSLKNTTKTDIMLLTAARLLHQNERLNDVKNIHKVNGQRNKIFVPSPPRKGTRTADHAESLSHALAELSGAETTQLLSRVSSEKQRTKTRLERQETINDKFTLANTAAPVSSEKSIVFVDDLITTGATATAAWITLGRPKQFEVWTIFHRIAGVSRKK